MEDSIQLPRLGLVRKRFISRPKPAIFVKYTSLLTFDLGFIHENTRIVT